MAKRWMCVMLMVGWLGVCATAGAQALPAFAPRNAPPPSSAPALPGAPVPVVAPAPEPPSDLVPILRQPDAEPVGPWLQIRGEYLLWALPRQKVGRIVSGGRPDDEIPGAIGQPGTRLELNGGRFGDDNPSSGFRVYVSVGEDSDPNVSLAGSAFFLQRRYGRQSWSGTGDPDTTVLARPFLNVNAGVEDADPVAFPGLLAGSILVQTDRQMWGLDASLRYHHWEGGNGRITFLGGMRMLYVQEGLLNLVTTTELPILNIPGNTYNFTERYTTDNDFYGVQFGAEWQFRLGPCYLVTAAKLAMGPIFQNLNTRASTRITDGTTGAVVTSPDRALYLSPNNVGNFSRTHFALVPEANARLAFDFTANVGFSVGYNYIYISDVIRPANQLDRNVNIQPVPDALFLPARTPPVFRPNSFWAQGIDAAVFVRF